MAGNPGTPGTGEVYHFGEGRLYLYASASGTTSGSGIGYAEGATLSFVYGWKDNPRADLNYRRILTGKRVDLSIDTLYADRTTYNLFAASANVNAKFEGLITGAGLGKSAQFILYSGVIDNAQFRQQRDQIFAASFTFHANEWSALGQ